jgi:formylglycine-generating enzyme required for sulfatase activity
MVLKPFMRERKNRAKKKTSLTGLLSTFALMSVATVPFVSSADVCTEEIQSLESDPISEPASFSELTRSLADFYLDALNEPALMDAFQLRLLELAHREGIDPEVLYKEIEEIADEIRNSETSQDRRIAERAREQAQVWASFDPYLDGLGRADRETIVRELLLTGRVKPLTAAEVEFRFLGKHRFWTGRKRWFWDRYRGMRGMKRVTFGRGDDFAIGQVPVTQLLYLIVALSQNEKNPTPSQFSRGKHTVVLHLNGKDYAIQPNHPVETVTYDNAFGHAERVSQLTGARYSLPSEKQWDFANLAESEGPYHFGNDPEKLPHYAWIKSNSQESTQPVGELLPNSFQVFDTLGNVHERTETRAWVLCPFRYNTVRGGSYSDPVQLPFFRSDFLMDFNESESRFNNLGFRIVRKGASPIKPVHTFTFGRPPARSLFQRVQDLFTN